MGFTTSQASCESVLTGAKASIDKAAKSKSLSVHGLIFGFS